jgi:hypothetical protein
VSCAAALPLALLPGWQTGALASSAPCAALAVDVAGQASHTWPDPGLATALDLPRARLDAGISAGSVAGVLRLRAVRSAGAASYIGVNGETFVAEVEVAEASAVVGRGTTQLRAAAGAVPDAWVHGGERAWDHGALWAEVGDALSWQDRSDLGLRLDASAWDGRIAGTVTLTSGEGVNVRERNEGKNLAALIAASPLSDPSALVLEAYARDGSRGLGYARDSRLGVRVSGTTGMMAWSGAWLAAFGVDGDATRAPHAASVNVRVAPWGPLRVVARGDAWTEDAEDPDAASAAALGALGLELPAGSRSRATLLTGARMQHAGSAVAAIAGAYATERSSTVFVQLDVQLLHTSEEPR